MNPITIRVWPAVVTPMPGGRPRLKRGDKCPPPAEESRDVSIAGVVTHPALTLEQIVAMQVSGLDV